MLLLRSFCFARSAGEASKDGPSGKHPEDEFSFYLLGDPHSQSHAVTPIPWAGPVLLVQSNLRQLGSFRRKLGICQTHKYYVTCLIQMSYKQDCAREDSNFICTCTAPAMRTQFVSKWKTTRLCSRHLTATKRHKARNLKDGVETVATHTVKAS